MLSAEDYNTRNTAPHNSWLLLKKEGEVEAEAEAEGEAEAEAEPVAAQAQAPVERGGRDHGGGAVRAET